jgi:hypothetical protein
MQNAFRVGMFVSARRQTKLVIASDPLAIPRRAVTRLFVASVLETRKPSAPNGVVLYTERVTRVRLWPARSIPHVRPHAAATATGLTRRAASAITTAIAKGGGEREGPDILRS